MSPKISDEVKEQRRQQILEAAERVFIRTGYELATMKDIVEEAEMSRGWIYLYFQTKEEIFEALIAKYEQETETIFSVLMTTSPSIWAALETLLGEQKKAMCTLENSLASAYYEYFISGYRDQDRRVRLTRHYERTLGNIRRLIEAGTAAGEFHPTLPTELIGKIMTSNMEGIMSLAMAVGTEQAEASAQIDALIPYFKLLLGVNELSD
ncbi:TetR family transcriptional regulator [Paenibacillus sp. YPG26]|uniref:TetR family transcriptional regulator n=1 Tax=Paenibacillus sp. YPG26 TaxID=2878915 RepID=UPI00204245D7|nr:TetR family transcriptional regulator [Paenibacillus sp. YPG26]USB33045.1 TetR family transcriptional regulator [Paenibacillus sp. YPG26]